MSKSIRGKNRPRCRNRIIFPQHLGTFSISYELCSSVVSKNINEPVWICLPEIYVASRQPLQSCHIQDRELVPSQTESLQAWEFLQDGGDAAETVEGHAEVRQALQRAQLHRQRIQQVTIQEKSLEAGHNDKRRESKKKCPTSDSKMSTKHTVQVLPNVEC